MAMIRPRNLPKLREQTLRGMTGPTPLSFSAKDGDPADQASLDLLVPTLRAAELWCVTPDMAALAASAGAQLDAARWATADRPSPCGLIHFQDGIGSVPVGKGRHAPVDGLLWGPHPDGLFVVAYISYRSLRAHLERRGLPDRFAERGFPLVPLLFICGDVLPVTTEPVPMAEVDADMRPVLPALAASWLLMRQPQLVDRTHERADKAARRNAARGGLANPDVTIVDLRRQYAPQDADPAEGVEGGRRYRRRWVVSGHWRNQPHGPGRAQRRQQWIPAYVKGPDGAPLLATERVNVWRR